VPSEAPPTPHLMPDPRGTGGDRRASVVLAFDTAGSACSVAVGRGDATLAHERREMRHGHAEALLPMIDRVMEAAALTPEDIDIVATSVGPGGFTGIRAGLAAAQGLALAARAELVGVTSFATVAALISRDDTAILVALDSRREDFYVQMFAGDGHPLGAPAAILPEDLGRFVSDAVSNAKLWIAGDAADDAATALANRNPTVIAGSKPDARGVLAAARRDGFVTLARPLYLRPPDVSFPKARSHVVGAA
jgi:tRNA threonylcarbamoyladenosine biosynthesis protein TsaB